jgi:hypothetical protein
LDALTFDPGPSYAAAVLAFGSAAVSLSWTLGGTVLLDTVGGTLEDLVLVGGLVLAELITHPHRWTNMHCAGTWFVWDLWFSSGAWL